MKKRFLEKSGPYYRKGYIICDNYYVQCNYLYIYSRLESNCPFHAYPSIFASLSRQFLLPLPVYTASLPRLSSLTSPSIVFLLHFPDYSASFPRLQYFTCPDIKNIALKKYQKKYFHIFNNFRVFQEYLLHYLIQKLKIYCLVKKINTCKKKRKI